MKAVVVCGRFNPITIGHEWLITTAKEYADKNNLDFYLLPTRSQGDERNPIPYNEKIKYIDSLFPNCIVNDEKIKNVFHLVDYLKEKGYNSFVGFGDEERRAMYDKFGDSMTYFSLGERQDDRNDMLGVSATKVRRIAKNMGLNEFRKYIPKNMKNEYIVEMFNFIRGYNDSKSR